MGDRRLRIDFLIHLFALAHALAVVLARSYDYVDDIPLTVLTIFMIITISVRRNLKVDVIAALALSGCFLGYGLGNGGADLLEHILGDTKWAAAITTSLITEFLGWSTYGISRLRNYTAEERSHYPDTSIILLVAVGTMLVRITYMQVLSTSIFAGTSSYAVLRSLFSNTYAVLLIVLTCILLVSVKTVRRITNNSLYYTLSILLVPVLAFAAAFCAYKTSPSVGDNTLIRLFIVALPVCFVFYAVCLLGSYAVNTRIKLRDERETRHKAQYQYNNLKRQINPHFLFNSLNILEYLVEEGEQRRASAFIRKLAGMYRYMLQHDDNQLVSLDEETDFAHKYIDLLSERFAEGLIVEISLSEKALQCYIVPCSLQLLIENATKHNIISPTQPLTVSISDINGEAIVVRNNLQPRINATSKSTGLGLKTIRQQYADAADVEIEVVRTKTEFYVKLPLIQNS